MKKFRVHTLLLLAALLFCISCRPDRTQQMQAEAGNPVAEWDYATEILMHTPGIELFNGSINPLAALFEHYFDVDLAAEEHRNYIAAIEANGIKVHTVNEILESAPIEKLREYVKQILVYKSEVECSEESHFAFSEEYRLQTIDQMSKHDLIRCILLQPVVHLKATEINTGVEAEYLQNPLFNLYFTRDQSINTPKGSILCKMNSMQRASEVQLLEFCYQELGIEPILKISGEGRLEGGDYIPAGRACFIGCGMRTNIEAIHQIMEADAFGHDTIIVVNDHKWWQMQMHLDTFFNIIDKELCTLVESRYQAKEGDPEWLTVDIYERSSAGEPYRLIEQGKPFVEYLQQQGYTIIPINKADELHYANNFLTIAPRHILAVGNQSEELAQALKAHGVKVEWIALENLIKGYGAAHCMTQVIKRRPIR